MSLLGTDETRVFTVEAHEVGVLENLRGAPMRRGGGIPDYRRRQTSSGSCVVPLEFRRTRRASRRTRGGCVRTSIRPLRPRYGSSQRSCPGATR